MIRVAIIGTGNIAHTHLASLIAFKERCVVTALCDIFPEKCTKLFQDLGAELPADVVITPDYKELLPREDIDLVLVCLPPSLHQEVTCAFLRAGKNVLCEKPMASSLEEADEMIKAQKESGKIMAIISQNRFYQGAWTVKKMMDDGVFGKVLSVYVDSMWYRGGVYYDLWWRGTWEKEGGGCILNHAVHQIDMLNWYMGELPSTIQAVFANLAHTNSEVEDVGMAILAYKDKLAEINVSLNDMYEHQGLRFQCEKAVVTVPWSVSCSKSKPNGFPEPDKESEEYFQKLYESYEKLEYGGHTGEIANVFDAIEGKGNIVVTGEDGKRALELIYSYYKAASSKAPVSLPLKKDDPFYTKDGTLSSVPRFYKKLKSVDNAAEGEFSLGSQEGKNG